MYIWNKIKVIYLFFKELIDYNPKSHAEHDFYNVFLKCHNDILNLTNNSIDDLSILILGCGYNYLDVILFSEISKKVYGLDIHIDFYKDGLFKCFRNLDKKNSKFKYIIKSIIYYLMAKKYYHNLKKIKNFDFDHGKIKLVIYDGKDIPFKNDFFDLIISNSVFQYINEMDVLFKELNRITKPGGYNYHIWRNFYSFSGGDIPELLCYKHPWGHLRGKHKTYYLNKVLPVEMKNKLSEYFDILKFNSLDKNHNKKDVNMEFQYEKEELLTADIKKELNEYPVEILLTRSYLLLGQKN